VTHDTVSSSFSLVGKGEDEELGFKGESLSLIFPQPSRGLFRPFCVVMLI
jgi:hypothetical protein